MCRLQRARQVGGQGAQRQRLPQRRRGECRPLWGGKGGVGRVSRGGQRAVRRCLPTCDQVPTCGSSICSRVCMASSRRFWISSSTSSSCRSCSSFARAASQPLTKCSTSSTGPLARIPCAAGERPRWTAPELSASTVQPFSGTNSSAASSRRVRCAVSLESSSAPSGPGCLGAPSLGCSNALPPAVQSILQWESARAGSGRGGKRASRGTRLSEPTTCTARLIRRPRPSWCGNVSGRVLVVDGVAMGWVRGFVS